MRKTAVWGAGILLVAGTLAWGQATLPAFYSGPWSTTNLPTGWTKNSLGSDYATDYDGSGGNAAKFDGSGDWITIYFNSAPSTVSYWARGNSLSGEYTYKVQESVNGSTWTDVVVFNTGNPLNNSAAVAYTNSLLSASRYVRFIYVTKAGGNVGLDGVRVAGPGVPSVSFNPAGTTNAPVSNLFTMAVSISPAGAGMQSWSMTPAYAGPASLTNGSFSFTPAAGDNSKTFTVSVIATNSIGTTTGTATIAVTPYVAPLPVITFSPTGTYSIMATATQKLGIGISPAGSGIQSWTFLPSNYAGSASLVGTNFTFISAAADGPSNYTLTVIATNVYGSKTGTADIAVSTYVPPPPPGAHFIDFESTSKNGYPAAIVTLGGKSWELAEALIGNLDGDKRFGAWSLRMRYSTELTTAMTSQSKLLTNGVGRISLWYSAYGNDGTNAPALAIEVGETLTNAWTELGRVESGIVTNLTYYSVDADLSMPVYVRIRAISGAAEARANIDNVTITDYSTPTHSPYDAFLLQYNVTPGDPGTAANDDLDGDGFSNTNEFTAGTNPYDEALHP